MLFWFLRYRHAILEAIAQSEFESFRLMLETVENPYYKADTAENILRIIKEFSIQSGGKKKFFDLNCL